MKIYGPYSEADVITVSHRGLTYSYRNSFMSSRFTENVPLSKCSESTIQVNDLREIDLLINLLQQTKQTMEGELGRWERI